MSDTHEFSSHSNRPWECRICGLPRAEHTAPAEVPAPRRTLPENTAAARELGRTMCRYPVTPDTRGHARYFGTDSRGDVFCIGYSLPMQRVWWDHWCVVSPDGVARLIPESEKVFGHDS